MRRASRKDRGESVGNAQDSTMNQNKTVLCAIGQDFTRLRAVREQTELAEHSRALARRILKEAPLSHIKLLLSRLLVARTNLGGPELLFSEYAVELQATNTRRVCGKVFKEGDLAYNCRDCQADPTCVLCANCFEASDHEGHDVTFHRTAPGGCCDCGDEEAWAKSGFCSRHGQGGGDDFANDPSQNIPEGLRVQAHVVCEEVTKYIAELTAQVISSFALAVPASEGGPNELPKHDASEGEISYHVLVHNDDIHTQLEVITALLAEPVNVGDSDIADSMTKRVDKEGRASAWHGSGDPKAQLKHAKKLAKSLASKGLLVSISKASQLQTERRTIACVEWLEMLADTCDGLARCVIHSLIDTDVVSSRDAGSMWMKRRCPSWSTPPSPPSFTLRKPTNQDGTPGTIHVGEAKHAVLLDDVIHFNPLLPKRLVKAIHSLFMHLFVDLFFKHLFTYVFVSSYHGVTVAYGVGIGTLKESILNFAVQIFTVPSVVKWLLETLRPPREATHTIVLKSLIQVLRNTGLDNHGEPHVNLEDRTISLGRYGPLFTNYKYLVSLGCAPLVKDSGDGNLETQQLDLLLDLIQLGHGVDPQKRHTGPRHIMFESRTWEYAFHLTIAMTSTMRNAALQLSRALVTLASRGDQKLEALVKQVMVACFKRVAAAEHAILDVPFEEGYPRTKVSTREFGTINNVLKGNIANGDPASYHILLHRFFGMFVRQTLITQFCATGKTLDMTHLAWQNLGEFDPMRFFEHAFRTLVMNGQIAVGLWRRNGDGPHIQQGNYVANCAATMFMPDVGVMQTAAMTMGANRFMTSLLSRFGLVKWFFSRNDKVKLTDPSIRGIVHIIFKRQTSKSTFLSQFSQLSPEEVSAYEVEFNENCARLAVELFRLLAIIATEVPLIDAQKPTNDNGGGFAVVRRAVIHKLAVQPSSFSAVNDFVRALRIMMKSTAHIGVSGNQEEDDSEDVDIMPTASIRDVEAVLREVAVQVKGARGSVLFQLKDELWSELDPFCWYITRQGQQQALENRSKYYDNLHAKANKNGKAPKSPKVVARPLVGAPPVSVLPMYASVRNVVVAPGVVSMIRVALSDFAMTVEGVSSEGALAYLSETKEVRLVKWDDAQAERCRTSLTLASSAVYMLTMALHTCQQGTVPQDNLEAFRAALCVTEDVDRAIVDPSKWNAKSLSVVELLLLLRGYSGDINRLTSTDRVELSLDAVEWCLQALSEHEPCNAVVGAVRAWHGNKVDMLKLVKQEAGSGEKKPMTKLERAKAAQKAAMARMMKAQQKAVSSMIQDDDVDDADGGNPKSPGNVMSDDEVGAAGENEFVCCLCRENDEDDRRAMAFIGFAQNSAWGTAPAGSVQTSAPSRKPSGWLIPKSSLDSASQVSIPQRIYALGARLLHSDSVHSEAGTDHVDWGMGDVSEASDVDVGSDDEGAFGMDTDDDGVNADDMVIVSGSDSEVDDATADQVLRANMGAGGENGSSEEEESDTFSMDAGTARRTTAPAQARGSIVSAGGRSRSESASRAGRGGAGLLSHIDSVDTHERASFAGHSHLHITFCSHVLHVSCMDRYYKTLARSTSGPMLRQTLDVKRLEFLCPVCKKISNAMVPFVPSPALGDPECNLVDTMQRTQQSGGPSSNHAIIPSAGQLIQWINPFVDEEHEAWEAASTASGANSDAVEGLVGELGFPMSIPLGSQDASDGGESPQEVSMHGLYRLFVRLNAVRSTDGIASDRSRTINTTLKHVVFGGWDALWFTLWSEEAAHRGKLVDDEATGDEKSDTLVWKLVNELEDLFAVVGKHQKQWVGLLSAIRQTSIRLLGPNVGDEDISRLSPNLSQLASSPSRFALPNAKKRRHITRTAKKKVAQFLGIKTLQSKWRRNSLSSSDSRGGGDLGDASSIEDEALWCEYDVRVRHPLMKMLMTGSVGTGVRDTQEYSFSVVDWLCHPVSSLGKMGYFEFEPKSEADMPLPGVALTEVQLADLRQHRDAGGAVATMFDTHCQTPESQKLFLFEVAYTNKNRPKFRLLLDKSMHLYVGGANKTASFGGSKVDSFSGLREGDFLVTINGKSIHGMSTADVVDRIVRFEYGSSRLSTEKELVLGFGRAAQRGALLDVVDPFMLLVALANAVTLPGCGTDAGDKPVTMGDGVECLKMCVRTCAMVAMVKAIVQCAWRPTAGNDPDVKEEAGVPSNYKEVTKGLGVFAGVVVRELEQALGLRKQEQRLSRPSERTLFLVLKRVIEPFFRQAALLFSLMLGREWRTLDTLREKLEGGGVQTGIGMLMVHFGMPGLLELGKAPMVHKLVGKWVRAWTVANPNLLQNATEWASPGLFETSVLNGKAFKLVELPKQYDKLYSNIMAKSRCPTTGAPIKQAALCLKCGQILCAGRQCCKRSDIGPCSAHVKACSGHSGAILILDYCLVLLVRGPYTSFTDAPYVDAYNETDPQLRKGRPLTFNAAMYEELQEKAFGHGIARSVVATRNMEDRVNRLNHF